MVETLMIHGSDEVMAPMGNGTFFRGRRQDIRVVSVSDDEDLPLEIREALVGSVLPTMFDDKHLPGVVPPGSRVGYACEIVERLKQSGEEELADTLQQFVQEAKPGEEYVFLVFDAKSFELQP